MRQNYWLGWTTSFVSLNLSIITTLMKHRICLTGELKSCYTALIYTLKYASE